MTAGNPSPDTVFAAGMTLAALQRNPLLDPLECRILLAHGLQLTRIQLITQSERAITADEAQRLATLFQRRLAGEPIAYIVGQREFYGLPFEVTPAVLIPRPDTELLVELALQRLPAQGRLLDMGTGSGAIAVALAHARTDAKVSALDLSPEALAVAQRNARRNLGPDSRIHFMQSDWYRSVTGQQFELIVSNPPYIVAGDPHLAQGDLRFEPLGALTDHADGLDALRRIIDGAPAHLAAGGWLLLEHGYDQAAAVRELLMQAGFSEVQSWRDLAGIERASGGKRLA
jgi:release factor glutamine methyltransferase